MPVLQLDDQQFPLSAGANRIGVGAGADVIVPGYSVIGVEAVIDSGVTPTIRRADEAAHILVNGVLLGAEPTPLMHGDRIEVAGLELRYADDAKGGATRFVSSSEIAEMAGGKRSGAARATAASGGRVVSLVDGKEYTVGDSGLVFGRDASCGVVVAQTDVSRRHAEIVIGDDGYLVRDTSTNGLFVNGERVQGSRKLARSDVLRIGSEEFRFYADVPAARAVATPNPSAPMAVPAPEPSVVFPPAPVSAPAARDPRPVVATEVTPPLTKMPASAGSSAEPRPVERGKRVPVWVWIAAALLAAAAMFFALTGRT
jgi:pSer/pThr/pTyr-binding forkhead associated (FHA) protein